MPLSDAECRNAKAAERAYKLTDGKGMHLLVQPNGSRTWRLAYRFDGKQRTLTLGAYPYVKLPQARELRDAAREQVAQGVDPMVVEPTKAPGDTFKEIAKEHHTLWKSGKDAAHIERVWARLKRDAFPAIGDRTITEIKPTEILEMIRKVEARGAIDVSKRLKQKVGEVFAYAIASGRAEVDPTASIGKALKPKPRVRHMSMVGEKGLADLVTAISKYDGDPLTRLAIQFTLLTAVRTNETRFMTWSEVDGATWRIPKERMKMDREHIVPLSRQAQAVLAEAATLRSGEYVFHGRRDEPMSENTMLFALYRIGYHGRQTIHGFRRLFSTILNERGYNRDWVELQLAHAEEDAVRGAYNAAQYLESRRAMMEYWAGVVEPVDDFEALMG